MSKKNAPKSAPKSSNDDLDALVGGTATETAPAAATPAAATPDESGPTFEFAEGFDTVDAEVAKIKRNALRVPTEDAVAEMVRSIKANGLLLPIILDKDMNVVDGMTRLLAYEKLGRKKIPSRFGYTAGGDAVEPESADSFFASLAANMNRRNFTPMRLGELFSTALKKKFAPDAATLAKRLGVSASSVAKMVSIREKGIDPLHEALTNDRITSEAAAALIANSGTDKEQGELLEQLLTASAGKKIKVADVAAATAATQSTGGKRGRKPGRRSSRRALSPQAMNADETGFVASVRKNPAGGFVFSLAVEFDIPATLSKFDFVSRLQTLAAKCDTKTVRNETDVAIKALSA